MPISKKWSKATERNVRTKVPNKKGVYELRSFGDLVYIGKAGDLQRRLLEHLTERDPNYYRYETGSLFSSPTRMEKKHLTQFGNSKTAMPSWNNRDPRR
jgi:excinuclease UvrABC nuclease subunit